MSLVRWGVAVVAAAFLTMGFGRADEMQALKSNLETMKQELSVLRAELDKERAAIGEMASCSTGACPVNAPCSSKSVCEKPCAKVSCNSCKVSKPACDCDGPVCLTEGIAVTTMARPSENKLSIGGEFVYGYSGQRYHWNKVSKESTYGWGFEDAYLKFKVELTKNISGTVKLNLNDSAHSFADFENSLLEEAYLTWKNLFCVDGLQMDVGKMEMPFGYDNGGVSISDPYTHRYEIDERIGLQLSYTFFDALKLEAAVFQNRSKFENKYAYAIASESGLYSGSLFRSRDTGIKNFATRLTWNTPLEGLMLQTSFVTRHLDKTDVQVFGASSSEWLATTGAGLGLTTSRRSYSWSTAAEYEICDFKFYAEYIRDWNTDFYKSASAHTLSLGVDYSVNDNLTFTGLFDYDYEKFGESKFITKRGLLAAEYDFNNGVYVSGEVYYEWMNTNTFASNNKARGVGFGTAIGWRF